MAEFFSFGTNDLTQMTFGFSRDDVEGRFMSEYLELKLLRANPFETLDQEGVGQLVRDRRRARVARRAPDIKLGICGEHGGDPASVEFCDRVGLDYVSCSPYRVPIARLAAAHASLGARRPGYHRLTVWVRPPHDARTLLTDAHRAQWRRELARRAARGSNDRQRDGWLDLVAAVAIAAVVLDALLTYVRARRVGRTSSSNPLIESAMEAIGIAPTLTLGALLRFGIVAALAYIATTGASARRSRYGAACTIVGASPCGGASWSSLNAVVGGPASWTAG